MLGAATRVIYDAVEDTPFAYARREHDFYRLKDHVLWAHESEDALVSARSGVRIAYRIGRVYYDTATQLPLYYER
jgi:hypothetical protein